MARRCKNKAHCQKEIPPARQVQVTDPDSFILKKGFCSDECLLQFAREKQAKKREAETKKQQKKARQLTRQQKQDLLPRDKILAQTQASFNELVRLLDRGESCITCDSTEEDLIKAGASFVGGIWDCGHYKTRGAHPELRFTLDNAYKQCKSCNGGSGRFTGKGRSVSKAYDEKLERVLDPELLAWLQRDHPVPKWTRDDLLRFRDYFRGLCNKIRKQIRDGEPAHTRETFTGKKPLIARTNQ